jgi:WD40 repeat protein
MLQVFATPIRSHALHAYHSAFVTMPRCLLLDTVSHETPPGRLPRLISPRAAYWGPSPRVLEGHKAPVYSIAFSPDGKHIVSGSNDHTVRVWNAVTFEHLAQLDGHENWVSSVAFSPDSKHIVSGSYDRTVRVWNTVTFEQLAQLDGHEGYVNSVATVRVLAEVEETFLLDRVRHLPPPSPHTREVAAGRRCAGSGRRAAHRSL